MLNQVTIQGNLVADPVLGQTKNGTSVLNIRLACKRDARNTGKDADFIRVTFWGPRAEYVAKNFKKGDNLTVQGRLEEVPHITRTGASYTNLEVRGEYAQPGVTKEMRMAMRQATEDADDSE